MKNQKSPREANNTTTTGTTIAGMRVLRFEEDEDAAAVEVAVDVDLEEVCDEVEGDAEAAAADVSEAYSKASVTVLVLSVVIVVGVGEVRARVTLSTIVVSPVGASAVAIGPATPVSVAIPAVPIDEGRLGFPMLEGKSEIFGPSCRG